MISLSKAYSDHRHLHSFPTRRSSDLTLIFPGALNDGRRLAARLLNCHEDEVAFVGPTSLALSFIASGLKFRKHENRSEEHTSELQSQFHLVCRLLLEKKKRQSKKKHS